MSNGEEKWIWDRYWHFDRMASCFDQEGSNYPPAFVAFWGDFFKTLPQGAKILDLCTGNGAIARMAATYSLENNKEFSIVGVDLADIDPKTFAQATPGQEAITFQGGVSAEDLPFPDSSFDAVVSQYGFEYTDFSKTIPEMTRVLAPKGAIKLLCHSHEAVQTTNGREELTHLAFVLDDVKLHESAKAATEAVWRAEKGQGQPEAAQSMLQAFQSAMNTVATRARGVQNNAFLTATLGLLKHTYEVRAHFPVETLLEKVEDARLEATAHRGRVQALVDAAVGPENAQKMADLFAAQGFQATTPLPFKLDGQKNVGSVFHFERLA